MLKRPGVLLTATLLTALLLAAPLLAATDCAAQQQLPASECAGLLSLWHATDGANWSDAADNQWNQNNRPCNWRGVTCSDGVVTRIERGEANLHGTLPQLDLPHLLHLHLFGNQLHGEIPDLRLPRLTFLSLHSNQFSGTIPDFSGMPQLQILSLRSNQLSGEIPDFSNLPELTNLWLLHNQLSGEIPDFSALPKLIFLFLNDNQLRGGLPNFHNLPRLNWLALSDNQLSGALPNLNALPELTWLSLNHNQFSGTLPDLAHLPELLHLRLHHNRFHGTLPDLTHLVYLDELQLHGNRFHGAIPPLPASLTHLRLDYNALRSDPHHHADRLQPDWAATQTIAPVEVTATPLSSRQTHLAWQPIDYRADGGHYQIQLATHPAGPWHTAATLQRAQESSITLHHLTPGTPYHYRIASHTPAHSGNANPLTSPPSEVVYNHAIEPLTLTATEQGTRIQWSPHPAANGYRLCNAAQQCQELTAEQQQQTLTTPPSAPYRLYRLDSDNSPQLLADNAPPPTIPSYPQPSLFRTPFWVHSELVREVVRE